jgi:hypothetical protein
LQLAVSTFRLLSTTSLHCVCSCWALPHYSAPLTCLPPRIHYSRSQYWTSSDRNDCISHRPHSINSRPTHDQLTTSSRPTHNNRQCFPQVSDHYCCCPSPCERHLLKHKRVTTAPSYVVDNITASHTLAHTTVRSYETRRQPGAHPATSSTTVQFNCKPASASSQRKSTQRTEHGDYAIAAVICSTPAR